MPSLLREGSLLFRPKEQPRAELWESVDRIRIQRILLETGFVSR